MCVPAPLMYKWKDVINSHFIFMEINMQFTEMLLNHKLLETGLLHRHAALADSGG